MWICAKNFGEAYDKIFDDYLKEAFEEFISSKRTFITISYGECRPIEFNGHYDKDCVDLGEFELSWEEFINEIGLYDFLDFLRDYCKKD